MKDIKFRAWDKVDEEWVHIKSLNLWEDEGLWYMEDFDGEVYFSTDNDWTLVKYTGLKDKNGVEIYEDSDVLKITNTKRFTGGKNYTCYSKVKIIDGHAYVWPHPIVDGKPIRYGAKMLLSGMGKRIEMRGVATNDVEVVGSIYENPELMENGK